MDFSIQAPEKNGYKFNEVTSLTGVKPYVLRFWETEFQQINPQNNDAGQKIYNKQDLLVVKVVKKLLFEDKLSIPEAKNVLDQEIAAVSLVQPDALLKEEAASSTDIKEQSFELKKALEDVISRPGEEKNSGEEELVCKASSLASRFKKEIRAHNRSLSESDVVNLVSAKKKLSKLLGVIENLEEKRGWS